MHGAAHRMVVKVGDAYAHPKGVGVGQRVRRRDLGYRDVMNRRRSGRSKDVEFGMRGQQAGDFLGGIALVLPSVGDQHHGPAALAQRGQLGQSAGDVGRSRHASRHPLVLVNASRAWPTLCAIGCWAKMIAGSLDLSLSWSRTRSAAHARISGVMLIEASSSTGLAAPSEVLSRCGPRHRQYQQRQHHGAHDGRENLAQRVHPRHPPQQQHADGDEQVERLGVQPGDVARRAKVVQPAKIVQPGDIARQIEFHVNA